MCDCLTKIDDKLREAGKDFKVKRAYGVLEPDLELAVYIPIQTEMLETTPTGRERSGPPIMAAFCPFCGAEWKATSTKKTTY